MSGIDRRQLLASLTIGSLDARAAKIGAPKVTDSHVGKGTTGNDQGKWFVATERLQRSERYAIEFWSTPTCTIAYADQLPQQIMRRAIWHERDGLRADLIAEMPWLRGDLEILEFGGSENLLRWLSSIGETQCRAVGKTALLALDSVSCSTEGQPWTEILSGFRASYDNVIGHFYMAQRGFLHWKAAMLAHEQNAFDFDKFFSAIISHCDIVIFSNQSLLENDSYLSASAPTEMLVSESVRRLAHVLLDRRLLSQIVPRKTDNRRYLRTFALGSAGASAFSRQISMRDLTRQRELIFSNFGKPILNPLLIATCVSQSCSESVQNQLVGSNIKLFKTVASASANGNAEFLEWFEFVTLWPFDWGYGRWP
jgi:hypothetical protein